MSMKSDMDDLLEDIERDQVEIQRLEFRTCPKCGDKYSGPIYCCESYTQRGGKDETS